MDKRDITAIVVLFFMLMIFILIIYVVLIEPCFKTKVVKKAPMETEVAPPIYGNIKKFEQKLGMIEKECYSEPESHLFHIHRSEYT